MRIRQIKPAYWVDARVQKELSAEEREIYIGLWMQADDAGWFECDAAVIGAELLRYEAVPEREDKIERTLARLAAIGRIQVLDCGHALVPTLTRHQRFAGKTKRVYT